MTSVLSILRQLHACGAGINDISALHDMAPEAAWNACVHPRHMLWLAGKVRVTDRLLVLAACDIARSQYQEPIRHANLAG